MTLCDVLENTLHDYSFYRAMHFSAKRGIAIACRPSVRLSVTLVDQVHIDWKSWQITARAIGSFTGFTENQLLLIEGASYRTSALWALLCSQCSLHAITYLVTCVLQKMQPFWSQNCSNEG